MGRGDARTKKGKIWRGSYGKTRPSDRPGKKPSRAAAPRKGPAEPQPAAEAAPPDEVQAQAPETTDEAPADEATESAE